MRRAALILSLSLCATCGTPAGPATKVEPPALTSSCDAPAGVATARPTRHDVTGGALGTRALAGRITAAGVPLANAEVSISCDRVIAATGFECADAAVVHTDETGAFRARVAAPATHVVDVRADLVRWRSPLVQILDRDRTNLAFDLPAVEAASLRVADSAGRPLAGVAVTPDCVDEAPRLATDAGGRVTMRALTTALGPDAVLDVCFAKPGYVAHEIIRRPADDTIVLARAATLCGRVQAPMPSAPSAPNNGDGSMTVVATTSPDAEHQVIGCRGCESNTVMRAFPTAGPFRLDVPAGTYQLWADIAGLGGTRSRQVDARAGARIDVGTLELAPPTASLSGVVRDPTGKPAPLTEIFLQRLVTGMNGQFNETARSLRVDPEGRFSATRLAPSSYRIQFGNQSEDVAISHPGTAVELHFDPATPRGCEDCDPEPFDAATYGGPWIPAFARSDDTISGPKADAALAPGVLPGDVIERSDGLRGAAGLEGKRDTAVHLRIFRAGTDQHLDLVVKRTLPAND